MNTAQFNNWYLSNLKKLLLKFYLYERNPGIGKFPANQPVLLTDVFVAHNDYISQEHLSWEVCLQLSHNCHYHYSNPFLCCHSPWLLLCTVCWPKGRLVGVLGIGSCTWLYTSLIISQSAVMSPNTCGMSSLASYPTADCARGFCFGWS